MVKYAQLKDKVRSVIAAKMEEAAETVSNCSSQDNTKSVGQQKNNNKSIAQGNEKQRRGSNNW